MYYHQPPITKCTETELFLILVRQVPFLSLFFSQQNMATLLPLPFIQTDTQTRVYVEEVQTHAAVCRSCQVIINSFARPANPAVSIAVGASLHCV